MPLEILVLRSSGLGDVFGILKGGLFLYWTGIHLLASCDADGLWTFPWGPAWEGSCWRGCSGFAFVSSGTDSASSLLCLIVFLTSRVSILSVIDNDELGWGRLAQRVSVRLLIQQSGFYSDRCSRWIFLLRRGRRICATSIYSSVLSNRKKKRRRHLLETKESWLDTLLLSERET